MHTYYHVVFKQASCTISTDFLFAKMAKWSKQALSVI